MPVYNAANTVSAAINSVIKQSFKDIELICIDDGSTDQTEAIIKSHQKKMAASY